MSGMHSLISQFIGSIHGVTKNTQNSKPHLNRACLSHVVVSLLDHLEFGFSSPHFDITLAVRHILKLSSRSVHRQYMC